MEALEIATNIAIAAEGVAAVVLVILNYREVRYLEDKIEPLLEVPEDQPLYEALRGRAWFVTAMGVYLLTLTGLGAAGVQIAEFFPPIRAINGALFLGLIAGPRIVGAALRRRLKEPLNSG